mmetsp:Transcript_5628/g.8605  ORF Transcript_5628/g.8605 Transcript_5628/m.8605 type:complete len:138 (-) Transcript_5628:89-502(-)
MFVFMLRNKLTLTLKYVDLGVIDDVDSRLVLTSEDLERRPEEDSEQAKRKKFQDEILPQKIDNSSAFARARQLRTLRERELALASEERLALQVRNQETFKPESGMKVFGDILQKEEKGETQAKLKESGRDSCECIIA